jgi:tRNA threonylcarbamoyladenosine biosynthesis protein TsaE
MVKNILSKSPKDTAKIAKDFLEKLKVNKKGATVVGLYGDLGTGKTAFTKNVGKYLGVKAKINSPTFIIMKKYPIKKGLHKNLVHLDVYRLKNEKELEILGWQKVIADKDNLVFIEWPEIVKKVMPKHSKIKISHYQNDQRKFTIQH